MPGPLAASPDLLRRPRRLALGPEQVHDALPLGVREASREQTGAADPDGDAVPRRLSLLRRPLRRGLGGDDYASSPTFVLISEYTARLTLYHVDLYRISKPEDTFELGLDEILDGDGLCVVEWAERALDQFPAERLTVELLRTGDETRSLVIKASESGYTRYLQEISTIGTSRQAYGQASNGAGS